MYYSHKVWEGFQSPAQGHSLSRWLRGCGALAEAEGALEEQSWGRGLNELVLSYASARL